MSQIQRVLVLVLQTYIFVVVMGVNYMRGQIIPLHGSERTIHTQAARKELFYSRNKGLRRVPVIFSDFGSNDTVDRTKYSNKQHSMSPNTFLNKNDGTTKKKMFYMNKGTRVNPVGIFAGSVLNQPVGRRTNHHKPLTSTPNEPFKPRIIKSSTTIAPKQKQDSLLDFIISTTLPTEEEPLFDFPLPEPKKTVLKSRLEEYNEFCGVRAKAHYQRTHSVIRSVQRKNEIQLQDRHLTEHAINYFTTGTTVKVDNMVNILLNKTGEVFKAICPEEYAPDFLVNLVITLFQSLYAKTNPSRAEYLDEKSFEWVENILDKCWAETKNVEFSYEVDGCSGKILASNGGTFICTPWEEDINFMNTDPLLDLVWHIYNAVASRCFECFHENYRMFHKYSISIIDLMTNPLQMRWKHDTSEFHNVKYFWGFLLGPNYSTFLNNVERCTEFMLKNHKDVPISRSPRFLYTDSIRFNSIKTPL